MFLQRYVQVVLDAVLGNYVKNIDPEALQISIWNGKLEVEMLELQPDALPLPPEWRIVKGTLHHLRVDLPWSNLANQPIRVAIEDVSLLLAVCDSGPSNANCDPSSSDNDPRTRLKQKQDTLQRKRAAIDAIDKATQFRAPAEAAEASQTEWTKGLLFKLLVKVLDNVQLNVQHVHLRIEDRVSDPMRPFAVGVTLDAVIAQSADAGWNYTMVVRNDADSAAAQRASCLRKKIAVHKLGLYWSLPLVPVPDEALADAATFVKLLRMESSEHVDNSNDNKNTPQTMTSIVQHSDYVVEPMTLSLKLTVNDGNAKLPLTHQELSARVMARLGTPWMVDTILAIGDNAWTDFVAIMPTLAGNRQYTLSFVFSEAWAVARELAEEEEVVPTTEQFKEALVSCLQWSRPDVERLDKCVARYRDAVVHVMDEKSTYIDVNASIDRIQVVMRRAQYLSSLSLLSFLGTKRRQARYARLRPQKSSPKEDPRGWWKYAIQSVLMDVRQRMAHMDWAQVMRDRRNRARYKQLYLKLNHSASLEAEILSTEVQRMGQDEARQEYDELEYELDMQDLIKLRMAARRKLILKLASIRPPTMANTVAAAAAPVAARLWSYTSAWIYGTTDANSDALGHSNLSNIKAGAEDVRWSDEDTQQLFAAINFNPDKPQWDASYMKRSANSHQHILYRFQLELSTASLQLLDLKRALVLSAALERVDLNYLVRQSSVELGIQLGDAFLSDFVPTASWRAGPQTQLLLRRMSVNEIIRYHPVSVQERMSCVILRHCEKVLPLIDISVEFKGDMEMATEDDEGIPRSSTCSEEPTTTPSNLVIVSVVTQAITCHVNPVFLVQTALFFARPQTVDLSHLEDSAWRQAQKLKNYSATQLRAALAHRSQVELMIDIISPIVTILQSSPKLPSPTKTRTAIGVFLGHVRAVSRKDDAVQNPLVSIEQADGQNPLLNCLYDVIDLGIAGIEVQLFENYDVIAPLEPTAASRCLLEKTAINIGIFVSITRDDPQLPLIKLVGGVDSCVVNFSAPRFSSLIQLIRSIDDDFARLAKTKKPSEPMRPQMKRATIRSRVLAMTSPSLADEQRLMQTDVADVASTKSLSHQKSLYDMFAEALQDEQVLPNLDKSVKDTDLLRLWKRVLGFVRFRISSVIINLELEATQQMARTVQIRASGIHIEMKARSLDKRLEFTLGSFGVTEQWTKQNQPRQYRHLIDSEDHEQMGATHDGGATSGQLIRLAVTNIDETAVRPTNLRRWKVLRHAKILKGPDVGVWQDELLTQISVDVCLHKLRVNIYQEACTKLFLFFMEPIRREFGSQNGRSNNTLAPPSSRETVFVSSTVRPDEDVRSEASFKSVETGQDKSPSLTTRIESWVGAAFGESATIGEEKRSNKGFTSATLSKTNSPASIQLRVQIVELSVVLHSETTTTRIFSETESNFVSLVARDVNCCVQQFPGFLNLFAYITSFKICDLTAVDPVFGEIFSHDLNTEKVKSSISQPVGSPVGRVPSIDDVLSALTSTPAIVSCALQINGADRIQEAWHPGYATRMSVRLHSPRIRLLYRFFDDMRLYFMEGPLLRAIVPGLFEDQAAIEWDKDFLLSALNSKHVLGSDQSDAAEVQASDVNVVSMFPLMDIQLEDAVVQVPVHRTSSEALVVRFDRLVLSNEYLLSTFKSLADRVMAKVLLNSSLSQFKMELTSLRVVSILNSAANIDSTLRSDFNLLTQSLLGSTSLCITADLTVGNAVSVSVDFSPLRLVCNREQYTFLLNLPSQNIGEASRVANGKDLANNQDKATNQSSSSSQAIPPSNLGCVEENADAEANMRDESADAVLETNERELTVNVKAPEISLELLHGCEGYQPSISGDMSLAAREKKGEGSICSVDILSTQVSTTFGLESQALRVSLEVQSMCVRDTRAEAEISSAYRDVIVFAPSTDNQAPSISIRLIHGLEAIGLSDRQLEWSMTSRADGGRSPGRDEEKERSISASYVSGETLANMRWRRASSVVITRHRRSENPSISPVSLRSSKSASRRGTSCGSSGSDKVSSTPMELRSDLIVDVVGFRVIPSNIHFDILKFLETPRVFPTEDRPLLRTNSIDDTVLAVESSPALPLIATAKPQTRLALTFSLGPSAVLLVEDPKRSVSRAVMLSWESEIIVDLTHRARATANDQRLRVQGKIENVSATSRLSQENKWVRGTVKASSSSATVAGDFLSPCGFECNLDIDFETGFTRLKSKFDRTLELRFGYLDVCSILSAIEKIVAYPMSLLPQATFPAKRQSSTASSVASSAIVRPDTASIGDDASSIASSARPSPGLRSIKRTVRRERKVLYGQTFVYLVSSTFRGPLSVRPALGLYSSPWRKRYLVLPFTAQERKSVATTIFRILPASGSRRSIGDQVCYGDRIALQAVEVATMTGDELHREEDLKSVPLVSMYDQLGASGYLGPDGGAGVFETRIWKHGMTIYNSDRSPVGHKDAVVFEQMTIYRTFGKGKTYANPILNNLTTTTTTPVEMGYNAAVSDGGGYLMFNGVGDAPIPFVISVMSEDAAPRSDTHRTNPRVLLPATNAFWHNLKVVQFSLPGIQATVVNDFHNMLLPLLHLRVSHLHVDARGVLDAKFSVLAGLHVEVQAYNAHVAVWEPLIEDFDVNAVLHSNGGTVCEYCMSDRRQISLTGRALRCEGIPTCLFGSSKTAVFASALARASETKHFICQQLLEQSEDVGAKSTNMCLIVIKKGITINISRNGINVILQFCDLVRRASSNKDDDGWQSRLGAYVYVDNQSGIPFMVAAKPSHPPSDPSAPHLSAVDEATSSEDPVRLPSISVGSEESLSSLSSVPSSSIDAITWSRRRLSAVFRDLTSAKTQWLLAEDGARIATKIVAHEAPAGSVTSPLRRLMWVRPHSLHGGPLASKPIPVPIGYSNRSYLHLDSGSGARDVWSGESIICETVAEQGTLVMRLHSKVQITNALDCPLEVTYNDQRKEVLDRNGQKPHFVPVQYLHHGTMAFCPVLDNGRLQASGSLSIPSLLRLKKMSRASGGRRNTGPATGALAIRQVLTFYWDTHPDQDDRDVPAFDASRPPFQVLLTATRKSEKHETFVTISAPILIENLVPCELLYRTVCIKTERDIEWVKENSAAFSGTTGLIPSGGTAQVCELEVSTRALESGNVQQTPSVVGLSLAVPEVGCHQFSTWTRAAFIYGSELTCKEIELLGSSEGTQSQERSCPLQLQVELVRADSLTTTNSATTIDSLAPVICRIYAKYWLVDRTCLSLKMLTADGRNILSAESKSTDRQSPAPIAIFSAEHRHSRVKIGVSTDDAVEVESDAFPISTAGLRGELLLGMPDHLQKVQPEAVKPLARRQYHIGVMIDQGPSIFSRTIVVTFVPRYYFINSSEMLEVRIKQDGDVDANEIVVAPKEGQFFHWNDSRLRHRVQVRFVCRHTCVTADNMANAFYDSTEVDEDDTPVQDSESSIHGISQWSLPFELTSVGNFVVKLQRMLQEAPKYLPGCFTNPDDMTLEGQDNSSGVAVTLGVTLHVAVELHDPAFVVRFHEGDHENRANAATSMIVGSNETKSKDIVSFRIKNECCFYELVVWQKIPVDGTNTGFLFEGGDQVLPFHSTVFVPFAATASPLLFLQVRRVIASSDDAKKNITANSNALLEPRLQSTVVAAFDVSMSKFQRLPIVEVADGKSKKHLWIEVLLDDATKTLHVTDILPGMSTEHKRRRRSALLRCWKKFSATVVLQSQRLFQSRICEEEYLQRAASQLAAASKKKVRFADASESNDSLMSNSANPRVFVAVRVMEGLHLEDLYGTSTTSFSYLPFVRIRVREGNEIQSRDFLCHSSTAAAPLWVSTRSKSRKVANVMAFAVLPPGTLLPVLKDNVEPNTIEIQIRESNKVLFGSSIIGHAGISLVDCIAELMHQHQTEHHSSRIFDLMVPVQPTKASTTPCRALVRVQLALLVHEDHDKESNSKVDQNVNEQRMLGRTSGLSKLPTGLERAQTLVEGFVIEKELDRLVQCKGQLKVLLERESVDVSIGETTLLESSAGFPSRLQHGISTDQQQRSVASSGEADKSATMDASKKQPVDVPASVTTDDSSDIGLDDRGDDKRLSVVLMGVSQLKIANNLNSENASDEPITSSFPGADKHKVYCTITYGTSTRSVVSSVAKRARLPAIKSRQVRVHSFRKGQSLGLDLIYQHGRVVVQGVTLDSPCGRLFETGDVCIGDVIVAVDRKSIVNLHRDASFRAIESAWALTSPSKTSMTASMLRVTGNDNEEDVFSLSFLQQSLSVQSRFADRGADKRIDQTECFEAEWNRRVEFLTDAHGNLQRSLDQDSTGEAQPAIARPQQARIRVFLRSAVADHGLSAAQESSVVPFLYFFGDDATMDHLDHSKQDTRFDKLLGECWVTVPPCTEVTESEEASASTTTTSPSLSDYTCALYAPGSHDISDAMTPDRAIVGQVRLALKWDFQSSWAPAKNDAELQTFVQLELAGLFVSIVDDGVVPNSLAATHHAREVLSISLSAKNADTGFQFNYGGLSDGRHVVNVRAGHLQIDNQLLDTNYPVLLHPIRLVDATQEEHIETRSTSSASDAGATMRQQAEAENRKPSKPSNNPEGFAPLLPTFQVMGVFSSRKNLMEFELLFAQLQELDVKMEDAVIVAVTQALSGIQWSFSGRQERDAKQATSLENGSARTAISLLDLRWPFPTTPVFPISKLKIEHRTGSVKVLLRWLLLCPVKLTLTFTSTTDRSNLLSLISPDMSRFLRTFISAAAALVTNLDQAPINIPEFYVENLLETVHTLGFYAMQHYLNHGLRSWYRIVGSVDFLGNPIGLVSALGAGVKDFFYTPARMLLEDENGLHIENLRTGMTIGSKSLLRNTAIGIFHTTGKITETLGKGIALLAMDEEYNVERQRQTNQQKKRINDLGGAIAEGGKGLVGGVWDGLKGVVTAPVRGAERDGAGGFVVGLTQGVAGLVVKPTAGFLDLLTSLSRGAKSSAEAIDGQDHAYAAATRVRLPRRICPDGVLVSYSEREARGVAILALTSLDTTDAYVYHLDYGMESQRGMLLLTDKRIICLSARSGQKLWELALDSSLHVVSEGAMLHIGQTKTPTRVYNIECENPAAASNFHIAVRSTRMDPGATRYLLLNLETKQELVRQNASRGVRSEADERVDLSVLMGNLQDTVVTGLTEQELQAQPLRSVHVELCHMENKDATENVPSRAIDNLLSFSVFQIVVYGGPYQWKIYRRFSQFRELHAALELGGHAMDTLPQLPPRTFLPSTRAAVATQRQEALSLFLQAAVMHSSITTSTPMLEFLTKNAHEVRVSLPPLSPTTATQLNAKGIFEDDETGTV